MIKLRNLLIVAVIISFGVIAFISCEKESKPIQIDEVSSITELTDYQIEYIGKMHNVYVKRAYDNYFAEIKTRSSNDNSLTISIIDLITYFGQQPESEGIKENDIDKIKEFYYNFKTNKSSNLSYSEQLLEYIKINVEEVYGVDYDEIINPVNTRTASESKTLNVLRGVAFSVNKNSEKFWRGFHGDKSIETRAKGGATIAADTAGALWGLLFTPAVSIIVGGVASIVANEIENAEESSVVFDGEIHTPKDI